MTFSQVWADDLTGAAEAAHTWQIASGGDVRILLGIPEQPTTEPRTVCDLDLRHGTDAEVRARLEPAADRLDGHTSLFFKMDSQLRGPVHTYLEVLLDTGRPVVLSAANPALGRITADGRHHVPGSAGPGAVLRSVFAGLPHHHLAAAEYDQLPGLLTGSTPALVTADVGSETDLDRLARYCHLGPQLHAAGSAPFLGALARGEVSRRDRGAAAGAPSRPTRQPRPVRQLLAVLGTTEPAGHAQVSALRDRDPQTALVTAPATADPRAVAESARRVQDALARGTHAVLTPPPQHTPAGHRPADAMAALAATCAAALAGAGADVALYLSGGHTARRVLDRLGLTDLRLVPGSHGAVARLLAPDGRTILTKPGSYGERNTLLDLTAPAPAPAPDTPTPDKEPSGGLT